MNSGSAFFNADDAGGAALGGMPLQRHGDPSSG